MIVRKISGGTPRFVIFDEIPGRIFKIISGGNFKIIFGIPFEKSKFLERIPKKNQEKLLSEC